MEDGRREEVKEVKEERVGRSVRKEWEERVVVLVSFAPRLHLRQEVSFCESMGRKLETRGHEGGKSGRSASEEAFGVCLPSLHVLTFVRS